MMSFVVKGVDLPIETDYLRLALLRSGRDNEILVFDDTTNVLIGRAIQISNPHGRLIDEKEILSPVMCRPKSLRLDNNAQYNIITLIDEAPTILEAEE
jgi:hypothetical protein